MKFTPPTLLSLFIILLSCNEPVKKKENSTNSTSPAVAKYVRKPIDSLTFNELWVRYINNPCYLPLLNDSNLWEKGTQIGFKYGDLFNDSLPTTNPYRNRFLVGDFNAATPGGDIRGVSELYPQLMNMFEFKKLPVDFVKRMDTTRPGTIEFERLSADLQSSFGDSSKIFINFLTKVWAYKMIPINRKYSIENNNIYSAGQSIALCEACIDTIIMVGRFAASAKRQDIGIRTGADGSKRQYYVEYFPTGKKRKYYAGLYRITSKNWETNRRYDSLDVQRDNDLGGGNNRITFFKGNVELPNFLLMTPDKTYPNSMRQNGIHEVALRGLSRGMLGTANSIGCLRVSDFGSKFLRWWVPQNGKLFVGYYDSLYHVKVAKDDSAIAYLPFKNLEEGNNFRKWINKYKPNEAKILEIGESGDYRNGYIIDGYYYFKEEYNKTLSKKQN